jgi:hypothetical protein
MRTRASCWVVALVSAVACGAPRSSPQGPVVVGPGASSAEAKAAQPPFNPSTQRVACGGARSCDTASEVCCLQGSETYACAPRQPLSDAAGVTAPPTLPGGPPSGDLSGLLGANIEACKRALSSDTLNGVLLCDDSTDCPQGQVCCGQWLWSGAGARVCVPGSATGDSVCDFGESCVGETCVTRGTRCVDGGCRLANAKVRCGGVVCGEDAPVCCSQNFQTPTCVRDCKAPNEDARATVYECSGLASCAPGEWCNGEMFSSHCGRLTGETILCESPSECPPNFCRGKAPSCVDHEHGFRRCHCD